MQALLSTQQHHLVNRRSMKRDLMCVLVETYEEGGIMFLLQPISQSRGWQAEAPNKCPVLLSSLLVCLGKRAHEKSMFCPGSIAATRSSGTPWRTGGPGMVLGAWEDGSVVGLCRQHP